MDALPEALARFIEAARVCRIATVRGGGEPHVIPVCPVFDGDSTLYVDIGRRSATAEGFRSSGRVTVLIDEYDEDWSELKAVLLRCRATEAAGEEREQAWEMIRAKFPQYKTVDWQPRLTLALHVQDWRQWGITEAPRDEPE